MGRTGERRRRADLSDMHKGPVDKDNTGVIGCGGAGQGKAIAEKMGTTIIEKQ